MAHIFQAVMPYIAMSLVLVALIVPLLPVFSRSPQPKPTAALR